MFSAPISLHGGRTRTKNSQVFLFPQYEILQGCVVIFLLDRSYLAECHVVSKTSLSSLNIRIV